MEVFGQTRSRVTSHYALITPDTHVTSPLIDWEQTSAVVHISPEMGATFTQYTATMQPGGRSGLPGPAIQRFVYVLQGSVSLSLSTSGDSKTAENQELETGAYAFVPADTQHLLESEKGARLVVFEKPFQSHPDFDSPGPVVGHQRDVPGEPFLGDEDARLQTFLPIEPEYDMAVNLFTYQPGATLPFVEIHSMEHGLLMTGGKGVYRLGEDYFPVAEGDVIWMASYCPQWFVAMGKTPGSYLYYKDIHRDRLTEKK